MNESDATKPLLSIFTVKTVYSGDPLCINYQGHIYDDEEDYEPETANMPLSLSLKGKGKKGKGAKAQSARVVMQKDESQRTCFCEAARCQGKMFLDQAEETHQQEVAAPVAAAAPAPVVAT